MFFQRKPSALGVIVSALSIAIGCSTSDAKPPADAGTGGADSAGTGGDGAGGGSAGNVGGGGGLTAGTGGGGRGGGAAATGGGAGTGVGGSGQSGTGGSGAGGICGDTSSDWQNCGACGHACNNGGLCPVVVGAPCCAAGKCAPGWGPCLTMDMGFTSCADACSSLGETCAADQCGQTNTQGYTLISWIAANAANCPIRQSPDLTPRNVACNAPLPFDGFTATVRCCCTNIH